MYDKKKLSLDMDELCLAMEDNSCEHNYYLDLETGEILSLSEYADENVDSLKEQIENDPDRYEQIPKAEPYEGYQDMQDFIATVSDEHVAEVLDTAIQGKGAFRRFKDILLRYPGERQQWFEFKEKSMQHRASNWLSAIGVTLWEE